MAIAYDAYTSGGVVGTSLTVSHTCTGSDRFLVAGVLGNTEGNDTITGVTYAGVAMTKITKSPPVGSGGRYLYLFHLTNPASGANDVVVSSSSSTFMSTKNASYTGCSQSGQPDSSSTKEQASGTSFSIPTTVVASNCWLSSIAQMDGGGNLTAGAQTTIRSTADVVALSDSNGTVGTGSQAQNFSNTGGGKSWGVILSIAPVVVVTDGAGLTLNKGWWG